MNTPINYARSLAALFIGFFVVAALDTISTALLLKYFIAASPAELTGQQTFTLLAVKVVAGLLAGYIAASLAGSYRLQHALLLAGIILCIGLLSLSTMPATLRSTFTTYALVLLPLCIVVGGVLRQRGAR